MSKQYYQGKYPVKNIKKYTGDASNVCYRSGWELSVFIWLDNNPDVLAWSSEETVIPYRCPIDGKAHRYFVDLKIQFKNGDTYLIEIKPKQQTVAPAKKKRTSKKQIQESLTYIRNMAKWNAALAYAKDRNYIFKVWTQDDLERMGIKLVGK